MRQPKPGFGLRLEGFITDTLAQLRGGAAGPLGRGEVHVWNRALGRGGLSSVRRSAASLPALIVTGGQWLHVLWQPEVLSGRTLGTEGGPCWVGRQKGGPRGLEHLLCARRQPGSRISRVVDDKCVLGTPTIVSPRPVIAVRGSRFFGQLRSACIFSLLSFSSSLLEP